MVMASWVLLVGTASEPADGDTLTRTEKKIIEKRVGDKWSLQCQDTGISGQLVCHIFSGSSGKSQCWNEKHLCEGACAWEDVMDLGL